MPFLNNNYLVVIKNRPSEILAHPYRKPKWRPWTKIFSNKLFVVKINTIEMAANEFFRSTYRSCVVKLMSKRVDNFLMTLINNI